MTTKPLTKTRLIQLGIAIALVLPLVWIVRGLLGGEFSEAQARRDRTEALSQLIKSSGGSGITLDRYNQVQAGTSIAKVETIVGERLEMSRSEAGESLTVNYRWQNADGSAGLLDFCVASSVILRPVADAVLSFHGAFLCGN